MRFEAVRELVGDVPWMSPERGKIFYEHIRHHRPKEVLELGIGHGTGSCYMAAALQENDEGHLTCVDLIDVSYSPSAEEMLSRGKLTDYVSICREKSSYTWYLKKLIEERSSTGNICKPKFDMCYIDGPKNWTIDGAAFFMVDKLMNEGGWIVFDDYDWVYNDHSPDERPNLDDQLSEDEKSQSQIEGVFRLLVSQHPSYSDFKVDANQWAWAHKVSGDNRKIQITYAPDFRYVVYSKLHNVYKKMRA